MCKADRTFGSNYNKPHVPVEGKYDDEVRVSCVYCGMWLQGNPKETI